jgi:hypothetical protein
MREENIMKKLLVLLVFVLSAAATNAQAKWNRYHEGGDITAAYDRSAPYREMPALWVRWSYAAARDGEAGVKKQFAADCKAGKLYELYSNPYDTGGKYLGSDTNYEKPLEVQMPAGSLHEATYKLLCF